ncbi:polyphenol oxidase family protein [bacterium]|nr:polyphenol oxidase family protein [bacterium]
MFAKETLRTSGASSTLPGVQGASFFLSPILESEHHCADFVERIPGVETTTDKEETLSRLAPHHTAAARSLGFAKTHLAEQVHGAGIAVITSDSPLMSPGVDGLITLDNILLGIHVADCGALYLLDRNTGAIGLLHSGKKGTELKIIEKAVEAMASNFGTNPKDLVVSLAPCIRPPHYEIDFATTIREQALKSGILPDNYHDCGLCTASNLNRFYSYRLEKGNTGRLLALLGHRPS